jgi:hypothetical protein
MLRFTPKPIPKQDNRPCVICRESTQVVQQQNAQGPLSGDRECALNQLICCPRCIRGPNKGPCALCGVIIPDVQGQKKTHYCDCQCPLYTLICPGCRHGKAEFPRKPKRCHWCRQTDTGIFSCIGSLAVDIEIPSRQWQFILRNFPKISRDFLNFGVFANFKIEQTRLMSIRRIQYRENPPIYNRDISHRLLRHFSVGFARMLICNMFGEPKTTDFFARKLMRIVFQRVIAVLKSMLFMMLESFRWW